MRLHAIPTYLTASTLCVKLVFLALCSAVAGKLVTVFSAPDYPQVSARCCKYPVLASAVQMHRSLMYVCC